MTLIYKIASQDEWAAALASGQFDGAPIDLADGYIHFSTAEQAQETAAKHFAGRDGLLLIALDDEAIDYCDQFETIDTDTMVKAIHNYIAKHSRFKAEPLPPKKSKFDKPEPLDLDLDPAKK